MARSTRRRFLRSAGIWTAVGMAGCSGGGGDGGGGEDSNGEELTGEDYPTVDEWLTETEIGAAAGNYDGTLVDRRDRDTFTVDVGAQGNGGAFAYGPPAVVVSAGTTVEWSWTGEGNPHNIEALPEEQLGESDYEFSSGEAEGGSGVKYTRSMDEPGIALYHCEPHLSLGMKGAVVVEE